jgi:hypothetical protein
MIRIRRNPLRFSSFKERLEKTVIAYHAHAISSAEVMKELIKIVKEIASYLSTLSNNDRVALRTWASNARLESWREDPIGRIKGVGLITFQYLRMMGGIDTIMPDKIVKRVINEILVKAGLEPVDDDIEFIKKAEEVALACGV